MLHLMLWLWVTMFFGDKPRVAQAACLLPQIHVENKSILCCVDLFFEKAMHIIYTILVIQMTRDIDNFCNFYFISVVNKFRLLTSKGH